MKKEQRAELVTLFQDATPENLAKELESAKKIVAAEPGRKDAADVVEYLTELLAEPVSEKAPAPVGVSAEEGLIRTKMAAGLTRDQAVQSITNQRAFTVKHEARLKAQKLKREEAAKK